MSTPALSRRKGIRWLARQLCSVGLLLGLAGPIQAFLSPGTIVVSFQTTDLVDQSTAWTAAVYAVDPASLEAVLLLTGDDIGDDSTSAFGGLTVTPIGTVYATSRARGLVEILGPRQYTGLLPSWKEGERDPLTDVVVSDAGTIILDRRGDLLRLVSSGSLGLFQANAAPSDASWSILHYRPDPEPTYFLAGPILESGEGGFAITTVPLGETLPLGSALANGGGRSRRSITIGGRRVNENFDEFAGPWGMTPVASGLLYFSGDRVLDMPFGRPPTTVSGIFFYDSQLDELGVVRDGFGCAKLCARSGAALVSEPSGSIIVATDSSLWRMDPELLAWHRDQLRHLIDWPFPGKISDVAVVPAPSPSLLHAAAIALVACFVRRAGSRRS